jgi:hypothetical protein
MEEILREMKEKSMETIDWIDDNIVVH